MKEQELYQSHDSETQLREEAINRYLAGEKPTTICRTLKRSRTWFYKVLKRYQTGGREALQTQSRRPHHLARQTEKEIETAVVRIRQTITEGKDPILRYGNIGAETIARELKKAHFVPPSLSTINRILHKHGLQSPKSKQSKQRQLPTDYPWPQVVAPNQIHLFDFVTRSTHSIRRVYSCNLLDHLRQWPYMRLITSKSRSNVTDFLVSLLGKKWACPRHCT